MPPAPVGRAKTRDRINRLVAARGISASDLVGDLIDRADDDALFAAHAAAYENLRRQHPERLREIEREDHAWDRADLTSPPAR